MTTEAFAATPIPTKPASGHELERRQLEGAYAGAVSRLVGYIIDIFIVTTSFAFGAAVFEYVVSTVLPVDLDLADMPDRFRDRPRRLGLHVLHVLVGDDRPNRR